MSSAGATITARPRSALRAARAALVPGPRLARRLVALAVVSALVACSYLFWLRDSSLVDVEAVTVTGLTSEDGGRIRAALAAAAGGMTTLHVDRERLEKAAATFPVVRSLEVRPDFPNGMRIHVVQHRPAAVLASGSKRVAVAADGSVLGGLPVSGGLPQIRVEGALPVRRIPSGAALGAVRIAAGTPAALRGRVEKVGREPGKGVVVTVEDGPRLIFGTATRARTKWAAAVRVLADRDAAGAEYVDVRIPERPVAGGLPVATVAPVAPAQRAAPDAGGGASPIRPPAPAQAPASAPAPSSPDAAAPRPAPPSLPQANAGEGGGATADPRPSP